MVIMCMMKRLFRLLMMMIITIYDEISPLNVLCLHFYLRVNALVFEHVNPPLFVVRLQANTFVFEHIALD